MQHSKFDQLMTGLGSQTRTSSLGAARPAFLEACAKEIANLPELGDGILHCMIMRVQKLYFDPPDIDGGRMPRVSSQR